MQIPEPLRVLWKAQRERTAKMDIFEIEGIGPLAVLCTWPEELRGCPWIHFIDHQGAQMCLIRGSGNSRNGDVIAGVTWELVAKTDTWLWIETVMSESNPIDGVSRHRFAGPWKRVEEARIPRDLVRRLRHEALLEGFL